MSPGIDGQLVSNMGEAVSAMMLDKSSEVNNLPTLTIKLSQYGALSESLKQTLVKTSVKG